MTQTRTNTISSFEVNLLLPVVIILLFGCNASSTVASAAATTKSIQQPAARFFYAAAVAKPPSPLSTNRRMQREAPQSPPVTLSQAEAAADTSSCCHGAGAQVTVPLVELAMELSNLTDFSEPDVVVGSTSSKEIRKRSVSSRSIRIAKPASCSPQPQIVELKPLAQGGEQTAPDVFYRPTCTRVNRCNGCCGSTRISCQPTETEMLQMRVDKQEGTGPSSKRGYVIIQVEQHLACKCDCRIRAGDCNAYQLYNKALCLCECNNTDARDKCLEEQDHKYWDDANCTCACRFNQSCTTGTVFDEQQCICTDPAVGDVSDRRRFIVKAVEVEPDNSTLYSV